MPSGRGPIELPRAEEMTRSARHIEAMDKIHALIAVRERSAKEARERLVSAGFSPREAAEAVETAVRVGLVSDERFARAFIRGKTNLGWGRGKIERRLAEAGVGGETVRACEGEFATYDEELACAKRIVRKHPSRSSDPRGSLMRRLLSRGFSYGVARRAVDECLDRGDAG